MIVRFKYRYMPFTFVQFMKIFCLRTNNKGFQFGKYQIVPTASRYGGL